MGLYVRTWESHRLFFHGPFNEDRLWGQEWDMGLYILGKVCRNPEQVSINSYVQDVYKESGGALIRVLTRTVEFITVVVTVFKTVTFATIKSTLSIITLEII